LKGNRRTLLILVALAIAVFVIISVTYVVDVNRINGSQLPPDCKQPPGGFLILASVQGYNDSIGHGAPSKAWPIITVKQGTTVNIAVCNTAPYPHGFQIARYYNSSIVTIAPGRVIHVSFVADKEGSYQIYCSIPCPIHLYMLNGQFRVTP
jgi:heme/copper-type cytochrome/quinol oxidase subunit 2